MKKIFSAIISSPLKGSLGGVLFALLSTTTLWAYDFESGGFDYTITSNSKHTVAVSGYYKTYSGHMQIPSSVVHNGITYSVTSIKDDAFNSEKCQNLTSVTIPNSVITIGWSAFLGCESLVSVDIGDNVEVIDMCAFAACRSLISICIPDNVKTIKDRAFTECASLKSLTIGKSVTQIGNLSFSQNSLETITCKAIQVPSITSTTFSYVPCSSATLYVLPSLLDQYKTTNGWNKFGNILPIDGIVEDTYSVMVTCNPEEGTVSGGGVYQAGATATLTATPKDGYEFVRWSDSNTANPRTLTVTKDLSLTAEFAKINIPTYTITLTYNPEHGTVSGDGVYQAGETATLTATPKDGYEFVRWSDGNTANPRTLTVTKDITLTAEFAKINIPTYTVTLTCNPEHGTVSGDGVYQAGETATLIATPKDGYEFVRWSDGNTANPRTLTITEDITLTAEFNLNENAIMHSGKCGKNLTWTLTYNGVLTISGTGDMYNSYSYSTYSEIIKNVIVMDGVTSIGNYAFEGCSSITSITIPSSVTSIGYWAFRGCSSLTSITIPNSVTTIGDDAFDGCSSLTSVNMGNSVSSIGDYAFGDCSSLTSITIPNSVMSIGYRAFKGCSSLTSITIPNSVTCIGDFAFWDCSSLKSIILSNSVTSIGNGTFDGCSSLISVTIPSSVTSIGYSAFEDCSSLISVTIPNSVTSIGGWAFKNCSSLTSINIPNSVTSIGGYAFSSCSSLTSITIPNNVTSIGNYAFVGCPSLASIVVKEGNLVYDSRGNCNAIIETKNNALIVGCQNTTIPNSVTSIGGYAFKNCSSLTSINIPNSVTSIGGSAFSGCSSLTSITIPSSVTSIGAFAFEGCSSLKSITIPNGVTSIGNNAFEGCSSLASLSIGNSVTSIGDNAFEGCSSLTSVVWNAKNYCNNDSYSPFDVRLSPITSFIFGDEVKHIPNALCRSMTNLTTVSISNSVTSIGDGAFYNCSSLISVTIPNSVTSIGGWAFSSCSSLTSITIPNSVTSIGDHAFYNCSSLASLSIGNSVTSIGDNAFRDCSSLASLSIGNSVTSIGREAFEGCVSITSVVWNAKNCCNNDIYSPFDDSSIPITSFIFGDEVKHIPKDLCMGMTNLTSVSIPNSVTSIGRDAFRGCSSLTSVVWNAKKCDDPDSSIWGYDSIPTTSFTFGHDVERIPAHLCENMIKLTSISIPNSVTSIGNSAFEDCSSLKSITIPKNVTTIGDEAFRGCSSLTVVRIPNSVTYLGNSAFYGCRSLLSVIVGNNVTSIGDEVFQQCTSLTSVNIGNSVASIGSSAFEDCSSLTSITIPNSVTSIGRYAFRNCSALLSVVIGSSVANLGIFAFGQCRNLQDIYCYAQDVPNADSTTWIYSNNNSACLHVLCESLNAYQTDDVFSCFTHIQCIESEVVATEDVVITPSTNDVTITWPIESSAETYTILITKDDEICNSLNFDKDGRVVNIAFSPSRDRNNYPAQYAEQAGNGFRFTITGLEDGTDYAYTITIKNANDQIIKTHSGNFSTLPFSAVEDIYANGNSRSHKLLHNGQLIILRDGKTYTIMGAEIK